MNQNLGHVLDRETWTQRGWTRAVEPDTAEGGPETSAISFVGEVCARTTTFGEEVDEAIDVGGAGRRGWWLLVTGCAPLDQIRVYVSVGSSAQANLVT